MSLNTTPERNAGFQRELTGIASESQNEFPTQPYDPLETQALQNEQESRMLLDLQKKLREYPMVEVECKIDTEGFLTTSLQPWTILSLENRFWVIRSESGKIDVQNGGILEIELPNGEVLSSVILPPPKISDITFHRTSE